MTRASLLFLLLAGAPAMAQEPPVTEDGPVRLSLDEAVQRALVVSAQLRELEQLHVAAGADLEGARAGRWPTADVAAGYTRLSDINEFLIPQPPGEPPVGFLNLPNNYALSARASLPIYAGGRISGQIEPRPSSFLRVSTLTGPPASRRRSRILDSRAVPVPEGAPCNTR